MRKFARRTFALTALVGGLALAYLAAAPILPAIWSSGGNAPAVAQAEEQPPPPRPQSVPARIPDWAWELSAWHAQPGSERGERPAAAPQKVPEWYWQWRAWRLAGGR